MEKSKNGFKKRKYILIIAIVFVLIAFFGFNKKSKEAETYTIKNGSVEQSVMLSGEAENSAKADLGFASSGRISGVYAKNNQVVKKGTLLARLEIDDLLAELSIKEANQKATDVDLDSAKENLEKVISQENAKVESAKRNLLTEDLVLTPDSNNYTMSFPTISGIYGGEEGQYKILITKENVTIDKYILRTFGVEKTETIIKEESPTPLGKKGLFVDFSDDLEEYKNTVWYLDIPNKSGDSYLANYNAFVEAQKDKDLKIKNAQSEYDRLLAKENNTVSVTQAEIQKIKAEIKKNSIYAPFDGKVTNIEKEIGENASVGEKIISVLGGEKLKIVLQVSELDVAKMVSGMSVELSFDSIKGEKFIGELETINSRDTTIDGVPVYEAFVSLDSDERIKTGMSATGKIVLNKKENVLIAPLYMLLKKENNYEALVLNEKGKIEKKEVALGIIGSDSFAEIISGLSEGDIITAENKK